MTRFVYVTESIGEETGIDRVYATPAGAIKRLRDHYGNPVPRGAIKALREGKVVFSTCTETDTHEACALKMPVW